MLDALAAEALTQHIELVDRPVAEREAAAAVTAVLHTHFQPEQVTKLPFEHGDVGVHCSLWLRAPVPDGRRSCAPGKFFGLANAKPATDHLLGQGLRIVRAGERARMSHGQNASCDMVADTFG